MRHLLWIDCIAAALAGVGVLALGGWLSHWYALPRDLLIFIGGINLLYASYSFSLAIRQQRPKACIGLLVMANGIWAGACIGMAVAFAGTATFFGLGHLVLEAAFVGALASLEWRHREQLMRRHAATALQ